MYLPTLLALEPALPQLPVMQYNPTTYNISCTTSTNSTNEGVSYCEILPMTEQTKLQLLLDDFSHLCSHLCSIEAGVWSALSNDRKFHHST